MTIHFAQVHCYGFRLALDLLRRLGVRFVLKGLCLGVLIAPNGFLPGVCRAINSLNPVVRLTLDLPERGIYLTFGPRKTPTLVDMRVCTSSSEVSVLDC